MLNLENRENEVMLGTDPDFLHSQPDSYPAVKEDNYVNEASSSMNDSFQRNQFRRSTIGTQWHPQSIDGTKYYPVKIFPIISTIK